MLYKLCIQEPSLISLDSIHHNIFVKMGQCEGFNEDLVLAIKQNFEEQEIRSILILKHSKDVKYFSRNCTERLIFQTDSKKKVCDICDKWFSQLSATETHNPSSIFTIDNFLNLEYNDPEKSNFANDIPEILIEDVDVLVNNDENRFTYQEKNKIKDSKPRNSKYNESDLNKIQKSIEETNSVKNKAVCDVCGESVTR